LKNKTKEFDQQLAFVCPLTSADFHPNGSLVAVQTMGYSVALDDLPDPNEKWAHLFNKEHGNVYSVRFDISESNTVSSLPRPTTLTQEVLFYQILEFNWIEKKWILWAK
jgi:hypothetical protein